MKKRILSLLLTLVMLVGMIPATSLTAFAAAADSVWVGGVKMTSGTYLAVGATTTRTTKPSGGYAYYKDGTLTLNNYSYEGKGYNYATQCALIYSNADLTIELVGDNTLIQTAEHSDSIRVEEGHLIINGTGSLTSSDNRYGIYAAKYISIESGTIVVNSKVAGIFSDDSGVFIEGGDVTVTGGTYGIYVEEYEIFIRGGDVTVTGGMYGIYAGERQLAVSGGTATIEGSSQAFVGRAFGYDSRLLHRLATFTKDGPLVNYHDEYKDEYKKLVVLPYIFVGGVKVIDGTYLANGATETTTTKPSGGYAYYKDGTLTLNNYSYEGKSVLKDEFHHNAEISIIDSKGDLTIELVGSNTLIKTYDTFYQTAAIHVGIDPTELKSLTIGGTGTLTANSVDCSIVVRGDMTVNSGTIVATGDKWGIQVDGKVTNNGGNITAIGGKYEGIRSGCYVETIGIIPGGVFVNSGKVTAVGAEYAIADDYEDNSEFGDSEFIVVADGMKIWASTTVNGALGEYVAANLDSYKKIVIESLAINTVNVSATWSGTPANATTSTTGATVTATKWYKKNGSGWTELGASDTIKEGNTYRCEVTVGATGDYVLADGYTVKINGTAATKKSGNTWYRDVTITGYTSYVDVYDIALPEAFTNPDFTYNDEEGAAYHWDVVQVEWFECDKDGHILSGALTENDVFQKDTYYRIEVTVVPETNWQFHGSALGIYINGKAAMPLYGYNKAYPDSATGYVVYNTADIEGNYELYVYNGGKDIYIKDGQYLGSNATGATATKPASGGYAYYKDGVLELNGYDNEKAHFIFEELALELYLVGDNTIGAIYDNELGMAGGNLETRQGNLVIDAADGGKLTIASNPLDAFANIQVKDLYFNGGELTSCLANGTYGAAVQLNGGNLYLEDGYVAYVSDTNDFASATKWDGKTDIGGYDNVWMRSAPDIYVGGVGMYDGDYLAVGATKTQTTKPSGGYAYYKNGTLTLNNYSYEGYGYEYDSVYDCSAVIYSKNDLTLELIGNNTLTQMEFDSDIIYVDGANLTVGGDGKLTGTSRGYALYADKDITINGGTVEVSTYYTCIFSYGGEVIINDGDITAESEDGAGIYSRYDVTVNGGNVTIIGGNGAINYGSGSFTVAEGMEIQASTTVDGELGEYVSANHDSYKKISVKPAASTHTVTFMVDTTTVATKTVEDGKTVTAPTAPTQSGKTFLGWYTDGGTKFDFTTPITGDITLTAKFEDATSNVKLGDVNGDDTIDYADIQCIYQHMSTDSKLTGDALIAADVNKDGAVDYGDIQRLYQHLSTDNKLS